MRTLFGSSLHLGRNSVLTLVSLFTCGGKVLLVHLGLPSGQYRADEHTNYLIFYLQLKNEDTEDDLHKQARVPLVLRSQHDNSTTV